MSLTDGDTGRTRPPFEDGTTVPADEPRTLRWWTAPHIDLVSDSLSRVILVDGPDRYCAWEEDSVL